MPRVEPEALSRPFQRTYERTRPQTRACDHPGCQEEGSYRAPRAPDRLNEYYWFCLQHVREYNRAWDYFAGKSEAEIEAERRRDSTWGRPSWKFGSIGGGPYRAGPHGFRDDFGFFSEEQEDAEKAQRNWREERQTGNGGRNAEGTAEERALAELDLEQPVTFEAIKTRYKELVKRLHPDVNGGDTSLEDKLKDVNQAYATLRAAYAR